MRPALTLHNAVTHWSNYSSSHLSVTSDNTPYSYGRLGRASREIERRLRRLRFSRGDRVGVWCASDVTALAAWIGIARAGCVTVPLRPEYSPGAVQQIVKAGSICVIVSETSHELDCPQIDVGNVWTSTLHSSSVQIANLTQAHDLEGDYCALLTSGSTGEPDLIPKTTYAFHSELFQWVIELCLTSRSRIAIGLPMGHTGCVVLAGAQLMAGGSVAYVAGLRGNALLAGLEEFQPSHLYLTNHQYRDLASLPRVGARISSVSTLLSLGDFLPSKLRSALIAAFPEAAFIDCWGNTEGLGSISRFPIEVDRPGKDLGRPFVGDTLLVVDQDGRPLSSGLQGVIAGTSDNCVIEHLSTARLDPSLVMSEDLGSLSDEGRLRDAVRATNTLEIAADMVVSATVVEEAVRELPGVVDAAVVQLAPRKRLHFFVVFTGATEIPLIERLAELAGARESILPPSVHFMEEIPATTSGKVDRLKLLRMVAT